jgi:hypothetical protein
VAFFEFHGEHSFAGNHEDEPHTVSLIDVSVHRRGILEPKVFLKLFGDLPAGHADLLHHGNFTQDLKRSIEESTLEGMTAEGIVGKGPCKSPGLPMMFKWKSHAWLNRLRDYCGENRELFRRLC